MTKKLVLVLVAGLVGVGVGAALGYGPLLRYKSEGVLSMEMGTAEFKRFSELAVDADTVRQYIEAMPPEGLNPDDKVRLVRDVTRGEWLKSVPKVSKADAKDLPDILLQIERDREKSQDQDREKSRDQGRDQSGDKSREQLPAVYLGVRLTAQAPDGQEAAMLAAWLGGYFKDVAAREAVREQVFRWAAESRQFSDHAVQQKLQYEFDIEQAQARAQALKKMLTSYPDAARRDAQQVVDVRKDNEKFMSPMAQLVAAESEVIATREKIQKLDREVEQQAFAKAVITAAEAGLSRSHNGSESVRLVSAAIIDASKQVKTDAQREKLASLAADTSKISARFLSQAQFVAKPSVPAQPGRPRPLIVMALVGLLSALLAAAVAWREVWVHQARQLNA